jgi:hypothetical protein
MPHFSSYAKSTVLDGEIEEYLKVTFSDEKSANLLPTSFAYKNGIA